MSKLQSINPSNYEVLGTVDVSTEQEVKDKVALARNAQQEWARLGVGGRVSLLRKALQDFQDRKAEFALLESGEMGMPLNEALGDFDASLVYANWYLDNAEKYLSPETTFENDQEIHQVFREPIGVAAVIVPWNFPFANFVWGTIQSLIAGNTVVFKHSEECPLSGKFIEDMLSRHLPKGVFNEVYGAGEVGDMLVHQSIDMIAFTGSTQTGRYLYELAGKKFIKAVMELGGSAPGIIFEDADIDLAVSNVCANRLLNQGQCCDGLKRLIVHESIFDRVVEKAAAIFIAKKLGNAEAETTEVGPLVAKRQLDLLVAQVEDAKAKGARVVAGGNSLEEKLGGAFFEPTVLTGVTKDMRVWTEEVFGPVLPVVTFKTEEEAIELANGTAYGLGAYVFTGDKKQAERVSQAIESGMVSINGTNYIMPFNPFGGYKNSGFGREHGKYGFEEVTRIKVITKNKHGKEL
ncbi:MAG: aldehyde dehydrogenase [Candidatus Sungbacteria bacterium]|nr:aldehyde dehydrogenase [Candidatus Sungbacteria bacterium]